MPIDSYQTGKDNPGSLTLGTPGLDVSAQLRNCRVDPAETVNATEEIPVLSGDVLPREEVATYAYTLAGRLLQGLTAGGFVDYTWQHGGDEIPFTFIPNTSAGRKVTGICRVVPVTIGGDVPGRPESDFAFVCIGTPDFLDV